MRRWNFEQRLGRAAIALMTVLLFSTGSSAISIINGSFESGPAVGSSLTLGGGSTAVTGWQVVGHSIDYIGSYWNASDGSRSLDLSGFAAGGVQQVLSTQVGMVYDVIFDLAAGNTAAEVNMMVSAGPDSQVFNFQTSGFDRFDMDWHTVSFSFQAVSTSTTLVFESLIPSSKGTALDNVQILEVSTVPEPSTALLMATGLATLAGTRRRRSPRSA